MPTQDMLTIDVVKSNILTVIVRCKFDLTYVLESDYPRRRHSPIEITRDAPVVLDTKVVGSAIARKISKADP
jgi:hypothetical protein